MLDTQSRGGSESGFYKKPGSGSSKLKIRVPLAITDLICSLPLNEKEKLETPPLTLQPGRVACNTKKTTNDIKQ